MDTSFPFSSSCGVARPTGTTFQLRLVGVPGGGAVRVCQGAPVRANRPGRCWVCSLFQVARRAMEHMAAARGSRAQGGAMVGWDGARGNSDIDSAVAGPTSIVLTPIPIIPPITASARGPASRPVQLLPRIVATTIERTALHHSSASAHPVTLGPRYESSPREGLSGRSGWMTAAGTDG